MRHPTTTTCRAHSTHTHTSRAHPTTLWTLGSVVPPPRKKKSRGWKQVSGDVFRRPDHLALLSVVHASGVHLACTVLCVLIFSIVNSFYRERGATITSFVICYLFCVMFGGFEGGRVFRLFGGRNWKRTMAYQCLFMPALVFLSFMVLNTTAILYRSCLTCPKRHTRTHQRRSIR